MNTVTVPKESRWKSRWKIVKSYIGWEDYIAGGLILLGALGYFQGPIPFIPHLTDFYIDIRSDLIGMGITVLIIDNVNDMNGRRAEKERLILQMGSPDHGFAIEAARQLGARRWLFDGSLSRAILNGAILNGAKLSGAILSGTDLRGAKLSSTFLSGAIYDQNTIWPQGFDPEKAGAILTVQDD